MQRIRPLRVALVGLAASGCSLVLPTTSYTDPLPSSDAGAGGTGAGDAGDPGAPCGSVMAAPTGYSAEQRVFQDSFCGHDLASQWLGSMPGFNNQGRLKPPLTGPNAGGYESEYYDPAQITVNDGLRLTAVPDPTTQTGYSAKSGVITTKQTIKDIVGARSTQRLYLQASVRTSSKNGMWPKIYLGPLVGVDAVPIIVMSTGFADVTSGTPLGNIDLAVGNANAYYDTNTDLSGSFNEFGVEIVWGTSVTWFWKGTMVRTVSAASASIPASGENETLFIALSVINGRDGSSSWHTVWNGSDQDVFEVASVQIYAQ